MVRLATIIHRHEQLKLRGQEKQDPTFKQFVEEYMTMVKIEKEIAS
jgi:hypothetical protein